MLYLVDSLLQASQRLPHAGDGTLGPTARVFRDSIAAALPRCMLQIAGVGHCTLCALMPPPSYESVCPPSRACGCSS